MPALVVALMISFFVSLSISTKYAAEQTKMVQVKRNRWINNFWDYQRSVLHAQAKLNIVEGVIGDNDALTSGFVKQGNWSNIIRGGVLYVYSDPLDDQTYKSIARKAHDSVQVGQVNANRQFVRYNTVINDDTITIPAEIPAGAIVVVGLP